MSSAEVTPFEFDVGEKVMLLRPDGVGVGAWGPCLITNRMHPGELLADLFPPYRSTSNRYELFNIMGRYAQRGWYREEALTRTVLHQLVRVMRKGGDSCG